MPSFPRKAVLRATLAAAVLALGLSAVVLAFTPGDVTIEPPRGGTSKTVPLSDYAADFDIDTIYTVRGPGNTTTKVPVKGISLAKLLEVTDADPVYKYVEIARPDGEPLVLSRNQIETGALPPVLYADATGTHFIGPSYTARGVTGADSITVTGVSLVISQTSDTRLEVKMSASKKRIEPGDSVTFTATATGAGAGESYEYEWNFGDGRFGSGAKATHRFSKRGRYEVLVTVKTTGAKESAPAVVAIQVGEPEKKGPDREGGGTNQAEGAPDSGSSDGTSGAGSTGGYSGGSSTPSYTPTPAPTPTPPPPPTPAPPPSSNDDVFDDPVDSIGTDQLVEGNLLADASEPPTAATASALRAAREGTPEADGEQFGIPTAAWGIGGALILLALGAGLEQRLARPRRSA